jgi:hypothetical protein
MEDDLRRFLTRTLLDKKVPAKIKTRLVLQHQDKPELASIIRRNNIDQETWYQKMTKKQDLKEAIKEELSSKRRSQLTQTLGNVKHQQLYTQKHPFLGNKAKQQTRIMKKIKSKLGMNNDTV